jgi:hypothetical protein
MPQELEIESNQNYNYFSNLEKYLPEKLSRNSLYPIQTGRSYYIHWNSMRKIPFYT